MLIISNSLEYLEVSVAAQIRLAAPVRFQQSFRIGRPERVGSDETLDGRRWVEHGIEHDKVDCSGFSDLQSYNGHRMALMLEVYRRLSGHYDFLIRIENSIVAEVFANRKKKRLVAH